jgi:hypothetical protein
MVQASRNSSNAMIVAAQRRPFETGFAALAPEAQLRVLAQVRSALLKMTGKRAVRPEHAQLTIRHSHEHSDYGGGRHSHVHEHTGDAGHHHSHADTGRARRRPTRPLDVSQRLQRGCRVLQCRRVNGPA